MLCSEMQRRALLYSCTARVVTLLIVINLYISGMNRFYLERVLVRDCSGARSPLPCQGRDEMRVSGVLKAVCMCLADSFHRLKSVSMQGSRELSQHP